ncbi:unnamed protein product [Urochloa humidicola]
MASWHPQATPSRPANGGDSRPSNGGILPRDILFEILLRLPAKQLRGPRAVCRSWRSLLSDPLFAAAHAARHPGRHLLAVSTRAIFDDVANVELLDTSRYGGRVVRVRRVARCAGPSYPCNPPMRAHQGLILVAGNGHPIRVVDPFTGAVSILPEKPGHGQALAASVSVLGRTAPMDGDEVGEYKVFSITVDPNLTQSCKVLTLGVVAGDVGAWREAQKPPAIVRCDKPWVAAVAGGVVYVLAFHRRDHTDWIAAFNLDTEQWRPGLLQGPPASMAVSSLAERNGRLVAMSGVASASSCVHLWLLMDCGDGREHEGLWQQMCTVPLSQLSWSGHDHYEKVEEPVWVLNGGRVAFVVWSPVQGHHHGSRRVAAGEPGFQDWVLRVYYPRRQAFEDVARLSNPTDVAIGVCTRSLQMCQSTAKGSEFIESLSNFINFVIGSM